MSRSFCLSAFAATSVFAIGLANAPAADPGEAGIQGIWRAVSFERRGAKMPDDKVKNLVLVVLDHSISMRVDSDELFETEYKIDAGQKPAAIDLKFEGRATLGICSLDGGQLKLCLNDAEKGRPTVFTPEAGSGLMVLKRVEPRGPMLFVIDANGKNLHPLAPHPVYDSASSPEWSRDGKRLAYDAWAAQLGENLMKSHIIVADADGKSPKDLGPGTMPSWSPDGRQIAFSSYGDDEGPGRGVYIMNADGSGRRRIAAQGWLATWSPTKNEIAYSTYLTTREPGANVVVYDVASGNTRRLLEKKYIAIRSRLAWSPHGDYLCFVVQGRAVQPAMVTVHAEGQSKGFKVLVEGNAVSAVMSMRTALSWGGDGRQILAPMRMRADKHSQLHLFDSEGKQPPAPLAGQDADRNYGDAAWSPDGKKIVFAAGAEPRVIVRPNMPAPATR
jgi:uncharacterized protein (TIGR03067 family)